MAAAELERGNRSEPRQNVTVKTAGSPLRIVLAYSDYPGANLVNNLNLVVTAPDGTTRVGNQREGGPLTFDTSNNVEVVQVANAAAGTWTIDVIGSNVPQGPQRYALGGARQVGLTASRVYGVSGVAAPSAS